MGGSFGAAPGATAPGMNPAMFDPKAMSELAAQLQACEAGEQRQTRRRLVRRRSTSCGATAIQIPANVPARPDRSAAGTSRDSHLERTRFRTPGRSARTRAGIGRGDPRGGCAGRSADSGAAPQGDATGRLQELDALKAQGVVNDAEYAAQRQRILDSI